MRQYHELLQHILDCSARSSRTRGITSVPYRSMLRIIASCGSVPFPIDYPRFPVNSPRRHRPAPVTDRGRRSASTATYVNVASVTLTVISCSNLRCA